MGEGGAIVIDNEYEPAVRRALNFGFDKNRKHHPAANNWKMSDITAAFILQHLDNYQKIREVHQELYAYFLDEIQGLEGVIPMVNHAKN